MRLWKIFHFEFAYLARRVSTGLCLAVLVLYTMLMNLVITPGDGVYANNTFHITAISVIGGLIWLVFGAAIAGEAAARDVQARLHPLLYTTPVTKRHYLGGRFLAALAVNALLLLSLPLGVLLSFYLPGMGQGELLPFRPWAYGSVYFLILVPTGFVATALQFTFAALSRQVMASYIASLLLAFLAQIIAVTAAKLFGNWDLVKLLDPVGVTGIVGSELQTWTASEKNTRLITLEGMFLWNRLLWGSVALGLLVLTYLRFSFAYADTYSWWSRWKRRLKVAVKSPAENLGMRSTAVSVPQVQRTFSVATWLSQTFTIAGASFGKIARHPVGLTLVGAIALASAVFSDRIMTQFGIPLLPTTQQVITYLTAPVGNLSTPWVVMPLLILYFSGELVWQERAAGLRDITDAAPVPEWVLLIGKFLGLSLIMVVWMALLMAGGIGMQLGLGYSHFEIGLYLQALFGLQLPDYLLFALLALVVHAVVHQKYIGYLVGLLAFCFMAFPSTFQVEHPLLIFGADPGWSYTDMRGFGTTLWPWLWFKAYWLGWGLLLTVAARLLWVRGREQGLKSRMLAATRRFRSATPWVAVLGAGVVVLGGSFLFYQTNVRNEYLTNADLYQRKAEYERRYGRYRNAPQPQLTATKLHIEIYPDRQQVDIRGAYTLVNKHTVPIDSIHIGSVSGIAPEEVNFHRPAASVLIDTKHSHSIYALQQPLQPGDSLRLSFAVHYKPRGFRLDGLDDLVLKNGTSFTNFDLLPSIGYQPYREINDAVLRKKYKLEARPAMPSLYDQEARKKPLLTDQNAFDAIIGTAKEEVAVAPGTLHQTWTAGGRRYFHYKTDAPIRGEYSILSGDYAVQESTWHGVAIRIYYHPDHPWNIDRMQRSINASLAYFTEQWGAYPYKHFTVVEHAGNGGGMSSEASMVDYGEQFSLMQPDDSPDGFDLPYYIMAHEVAHQWWGGAGLTPANVEGAGVLVEGLAVYSGMQVLEKNYGEVHLQRYVDFLHSFYEMPRSLATAPLLRANETFLYYRKGGLAMYALSKYIGKEKVNGALGSLLQKHRAGKLPVATTLDLYAALENVTPDSLRYLLHDLFQKNTYRRLKTEQMAAAPTPAGNWQVTLKVQAHKVVVDSTGNEQEVPMHDWLEIGVYEEGKGLNEPLYLQMHLIRSGEQTIQLSVPRKPASGGIDPNHMMIDVRRDDNMKSMGGED